MKRILFLIAALLPCWGGFGAEYTPRHPNPSNVRIVPVNPTPEPTHVETVIQLPRHGQVTYRSPVNVQILLSGYPLGTNSDFERAEEIFNDPNGQSLIVIIDNYHPIEIYKSFVDSLNDSNLFFDLTLNTDIPFDLSEGMHVIRAFPDRSYGESLKGPGSFTSSVFYYGQQINNLDVDLNGPYLTYNEPLETMVYRGDKPILLDFYLTNVQLSRDGYKVRATIDGNIERTLVRWVPYYIYGLDSGTHTVKLELIDEKNEVVPGIFNTAERTITVQ